MEGFNNKIGWLTRQAYGYRDEEYLIFKIFDLPNLKTLIIYRLLRRGFITDQRRLNHNI